MGLRRYDPGYISGLNGAGHMRRTLNITHEAGKVFELLNRWEASLARGGDVTEIAWATRRAGVVECGAALRRAPPWRSPSAAR